jgi:hypothetical protein
MDREKYFAELSRVLAKEEIETAPVQNGRLPVLLNGQPAFQVEAPGFLCIFPGDLRTPEASELYHHTAPIAEMVKEYMMAIAGWEMEKNYGHKFVTWQWDYDKTGVGIGHYFIDEYTAAKEDFAIRSGLIQKEKLFTSEQLTEVYKCIKGMLEGGYELTYDSERKLGDIREQIESIVPDVEERIAQAQGQTPQMNM